MTRQSDAAKKYCRVICHKAPMVSSMPFSTGAVTITT